MTWMIWGGKPPHVSHLLGLQLNFQRRISSNFWRQPRHQDTWSSMPSQWDTRCGTPNHQHSPASETFGAHILQDLTISYNITHIPKKGISHTKPWWGIGLISGFTSFAEIPNSNFSPRAGGFIEAAEECSSLSMRPWTMWNDRSEIGDMDLKNW